MKRKRLNSIATFIFVFLSLMFFSLQKVDAVDEDLTINPSIQLNALFEKYYNNGEYIKDTEIFLNDQAIIELSKNLGFHNDVDILQRRTYFVKDALWMSHGDRDTKYSYYGTLNGNMTGGVVDNVGDTVNSIAAKGKSMEDFYITLFDLKAKEEHGWNLKNDVYSTDNLEVIEWFKAITAPCYIGFNEPTSSYITLSMVTVEEEDDTLILSLYASELDEGKLTSGSTLFAKATIFFNDPNAEPGVAATSSFERFLEKYPNYSGSEEDWLNDILNKNECNLYGHDYIDTVVSSTCQHEGYTKHKCQKCQYEVIDSYTSISEHNFENDICSYCNLNIVLENAEYVNDNDWVIAIFEDTYYLVDYVGTENRLTIPSTYENSYLDFTYFYPKSVFDEYRDTLTYIKFPSNYTKEIPLACFTMFNQLETFVCGNGVTRIGQFAFSDCLNLKNISIGENVKSIGYGAFSFCESLEQVVYNAIDATCDLYDERFGSFINNWECFSKGGYSSGGVTLTIGDNVRYLPSQLFRKDYSFPRDWHFNVKKIEISEYSVLREIGYECFSESDIEEIILPASLTIVNNSFYNCVVNKVYYYGDESMFRNIENYQQIPGNIYFYSADKPNTDNANYMEFCYEETYNENGELEYIINQFYNYDGKNVIYLPKMYNDAKVTGVRELCYYSYDIEVIVLPETIKYINPYAFDGTGARVIIFNGTKAQWEAIENSWIIDQNYIVVCVGSNQNYWYNDYGNPTIWQ